MGYHQLGDCPGSSCLIGRVNGSNSVEDTGTVLR